MYELAEGKSRAQHARSVDTLDGVGALEYHPAKYGSKAQLPDQQRPWKTSGRGEERITSTGRRTSLLHVVVRLPVSVQLGHAKTGHARLTRAPHAWCKARQHAVGVPKREAGESRGKQVRYLVGVSQFV